MPASLSLVAFVSCGCLLLTLAFAQDCYICGKYDEVAVNFGQQPVLTCPAGQLIDRIIRATWGNFLAQQCSCPSSGTGCQSPVCDITPLSSGEDVTTHATIGCSCLTSETGPTCQGGTTCAAANQGMIDVTTWTELQACVGLSVCKVAPALSGCQVDGVDPCANVYKRFIVEAYCRPSTSPTPSSSSSTSPSSSASPSSPASPSSSASPSSPASPSSRASPSSPASASASVLASVLASVSVSVSTSTGASASTGTTSTPGFLAAAPPDAGSPPSAASGSAGTTAPSAIAIEAGVGGGAGALALIAAIVGILAKLGKLPCLRKKSDAQNNVVAGDAVVAPHGLNCCTSFHMTHQRTSNSNTNNAVGASATGSSATRPLVAPTLDDFDDELDDVDHGAVRLDKTERIKSSQHTKSGTAATSQEEDTPRIKSSQHTESGTAATSHEEDSAAPPNEVTQGVVDTVSDDSSSSTATEEKQTSSGGTTSGEYSDRAWLCKTSSSGRRSGSDS